MSAQTAMGPVLILAGGTGGHVFPAVAVAEALREREVPVVWMGTRRGLEARVVPALGFPMEWITIGGLRGKGALSWLLAPIRLARALAQALPAVRRHRPAVVLGMGGFVTGPGGVAAWLLRRPLLIHEQNAIAGLTNRMLARLAARALAGFPGAFPTGRRYAPVTVTGNPVREPIAALETPETRLAGREGPVRVLVLGGSQGARALNRAVPGAVARLGAEDRPVVHHQSGAPEHDAAQRAYREAGIDARVEPFIADMAGAYAWADLIVCRAGALTVAEIAAAGVASILVPYPYAVDDHQTVNARHLVEADAAVLVPDAELDEARLADLLEGLARDRQRLCAMACAARRLARPDAASAVARACFEAAGVPGPDGERTTGAKEGLR